MGRNRERGIIEAVIIILIWFTSPEWEKLLLSEIKKDPNSMGYFGTYWVDIVQFLYNYWEIISIIILIEAVYAAITRRNIINDLAKEIKRAISEFEKRHR